VVAVSFYLFWRLRSHRRPRSGSLAHLKHLGLSVSPSLRVSV